MIFSTLPQNIQYQIYLLTSDEQFQKRFGEDEVLDQLENLKYDPFIEYCEMQLLFHNKLKFNEIEYQPLTLGLWSFLYTLKSPIVINDKNISMVDIDLFFYLLQTKDYAESLDKLLLKSVNYCKEKLHLEGQQAVDLLQKMIKIHFRVLNMFPKLQAERKSTFNADWITSIVTKVKQVSSYSTQELYKQISFCEVYYLFAQYCREKGSESIYLRTEEEIQIQIDFRSTQLVVDRLIEKGVIPSKDRDYYIKQIHIVKTMENN